jgi:hypothetical protein
VRFYFVRHETQHSLVHKDGLKRRESTPPLWNFKNPLDYGSRRGAAPRRHVGPMADDFWFGHLADYQKMNGRGWGYGERAAGV